MHYLLVFIGGGIGSMTRLFMSSFVGKNAGTNFPWGTLSVNLIGAFAIGAIIELLALKLSVPDNFRYLLVTGFLGGFTTFSAFSLECSSMIARNDYLNTAIYILLSVIGSILLVFFSSNLVKSII